MRRMNNRQGGLVGVQAIVVGVQTMCVLVRHACVWRGCLFWKTRVGAHQDECAVCLLQDECAPTYPTDHASV